MLTSLNKAVSAVKAAPFNIRAALFPSTIWEQSRPLSYAEEMCSLFRVEDDGCTVTKDGRLAYVVELVGKDYSGLDLETMNGLYLGRKMFFETIPEGVTVFAQSHRQKTPISISMEGYSNDMAKRLAEKWYSTFTHAYRSRHFLVFTDTHQTLKKKLKGSVEKRVNTQMQESRGVLKSAVEACLQKFAGSEDEASDSANQGYNPRLLTGKDLVSYWAFLLSGHNVQAPYPEDGIIDETLGHSALLWPKGANFQVYETPTGRKYSAWLFIKRPNSISNEDLMNELFKVRETFSVYSHYTPQERAESFERLEARERNFRRAEKAADEIRAEVEGMAVGLQNNDFVQYHVWLAIEVFGDDLDHLKDAIHKVSQAVENNNFTVARETVNQEATFWMRFPGMEHIQPRKRECTSENAAHLTTFSSVGEGLQRCTWGDGPIVHLPTTSGSVYSLTLHQSTMKKALGNSLVIGGSEVGKTTLMNFIGSNCFRYPDFRILALDKRQGMNVWTALHDGLYLTNLDMAKLQINPLQMSDTDANRVYLGQWLNQIAGKLEDDDKDALEKALLEIYNIEDVSKRNLTELHPAIKSKSETAAKRIEKWLPDGSHGAYFNGASDGLNFKDHQLVTVDMTLLLSRPEILGPLASYVFHRNLEQADGVHGYMVLIDEIRNYLTPSNPISPYLIEEWCEIRKNGGVICGMAQTAKQLLNFPGLDDFLMNTATFILFPEPKADAKDYMGKLGLNETEFAWIKNTSPTSRTALLKRRRGESVFLDLDLARLGKYMKTFNSGTDAVRRIKELRESHDDWKDRYFAE